jgi:6,7-dimethyl-8-ribityllumazine synthase
MSKFVPMRPRHAQKATLSFAIVASQYNAQYTQALVDNAYGELSLLEPGAAVSLFSSPGSFEIPLMVQMLAETERYQAIIALGVLLQGETAHATLVSQSVTNALMDISLANRIPVIHGVLLLENEEQARARCVEMEFNRGVEAARAAVAAARALRDIK